MIGRLPLASLLSHALVAFTIEFDNEAERRMAHRTTSHGSTAGSLHAPWLVSMAMWFNCMRHVGEEGIRAGELEALARTPTNLNGMVRWRYITAGPDPGDRSKKPRRSDWLIRATPGGRKAQEVWRPLTGDIEERWQARFGKDEIDDLREALGMLIGRFGIELPDCLPILGYGLWSDRFRRTDAKGESGGGTNLELPALLAKVLLAFALEFEKESEVSLAISANVLRLVGEEGVRVRDLPRLSAVSKEALAMALSFLGKRGYAMVQTEPSGRLKVVLLTSKGRAARETYHQLVWTIEKRWHSRFGEEGVARLRDSLERLAGDGTVQGSPLFGGLEPYPDGWRASLPRPEGLPHYPMVLHRGGYPDGS